MGMLGTVNRNANTECRLKEHSMYLCQLMRNNICSHFFGACRSLIYLAQRRNNQLLSTQFPLKVSMHSTTAFLPCSNSTKVYHC